MTKQEFIAFLEDNVLSIFTGSAIEGEEESSPRDILVAQGSGGSILVKQSKKDDYRFIIKRIQPFKSFEISLVRSIIDELRDLGKYSLKATYLSRFYEGAIEHAICKSVSPKASETLSELITELTGWGNRTYEGDETCFGFLIYPTKAPEGTPKNTHFSEILSHDFSAMLSNGLSSCLKLTIDGYLTGYATLPACAKKDILSPLSDTNMANACRGNIVGISLIGNGDILIFKNQQLLFARRSGSWASYSHEEIIQRLADKKESTEEIRRAIYLSCLDISSTAHGGCIVHLNKGGNEAVLKHIDIFDILNPAYYHIKLQNMGQYSFFDNEPENPANAFPENYDEFLKLDKSAKISSMNKVIAGKRFDELDRGLRQELLSVDGATVLSNSGEIVAVGAIIKIDAGSTGGGRLAATKTLAQYGVALKISTDGSIQCFHSNKDKVVKPIFYIK